MNAFAMKLESRQLLTVTNEEKHKDLSGLKKCKSIKNRNFSSNTNKDALVNRHGLGREFCDGYDLKRETTQVPNTRDSSNEIHSKKMNLKTDKMFSECDKIQERLQRSLSTEDKEKVMSILNEVKSLSDIEKLFLYLQLPTGSSFEVDPFKQKNVNPLGKKADEEGLFAVTWIQSHLEEDPDVSLPKQEVYDEYQTYCSLSGTDPLCAADFGKVMKQIFPAVKPRRLGTRGNSRYCYSGLRKKLKMAPPSVPDLQKEKENRTSEESVYDEVTSAACHLLYEWAEKLLGIKFSSLKELATHLLENMYVDNRSVAAFTVLLDASPQLLSKGCVTGEGGVKKSEAQFHLQRKIQEKELIKEQKRKLQEQRSNILSVSKGKGIPGKKKGGKSRKSRSSPDDFTCDEEKPVVDAQNPNKGKDKISEYNDLKKCEEIILQVQNAEITLQSPDVINIKKEESFSKGESIINTKMSERPLSRLSKSPLSSPSSSSLGEMDDSAKKKNKSIAHKNSKPPVCIAQSLSGILIVPSLPQISSDMGKQGSNAPKYKRIQPKPLQSELFSTVARARAGSVGSCLPLRPKSHSNDGRRSSHACLQSNSFTENGEEKSQKHIFLREIPENALKEDSGFRTSENVININGKDVSLEKSKLQLKSRLLVRAGLQMKNLSQTEDSTSVKRHLEENDDFTKNKRVHLESPSESIWISNTGASNSNSILKVNTNKHIGYEEVNVHEIEGDALNDYFRSNHGSISLSHQNELEQQISSTHKVKQLSQLRMLLEQNLPGAISKTMLGSTKTNKISKSVDTSENLQPFLQEDLRFQDATKTLLSNAVFENSLNSSDVPLKNDLQLETLTLEKLLSSDCLASDTVANMNNQILSDPSVFLNCPQNNIQDMDISLQNEINQNPNTDDILLTTSLLSDADLVSKQANESVVYGRVNTYTQVPSVPQSPNTRRRAFNFMPISPRHTPVPDAVPVNGTPSVSSPHMRMMMSTGVGPSQPPSNSGSPFVSPRSTPVPLCRSRHSSGQSTYSTSCHTPFQNFDSGVSSVSSSPFISPQPTPIPVSRLRHNSTHASSKTVTFSSVNSPQVIHPLSTSNNIRTRHSSGPGAHHLVTSPGSSSLSPLVAEQPSTQSFMFPAANELRSRHNSGSNATTPLSPVSEQVSSSSSCTSSNIPDLSTINDVSQSFLNDGAGDLLISANPSSFKQVRHRHVSGSVIYGKSSYSQQDIFSQEIQKLLKNSQNTGASDLMLSHRSQSVPLHQMLQTADGLYFLQSVDDSCHKSQPSTPVMNQMFSFPTLSSNTDASSLTLAMDVNTQEKSINQNSQMEWSSLDSSHELETSSARRNLSILYDAPPLSDDLQTTLEDLRDCDTDFSKLELELRQTEETGL